MKSQQPTFIFPLEYAAMTVSCKVIMQPDAYDVLFDGRWMASIAHTYDWTWIQSSGVILPDDVIEEIGLRVESEYK